MHVNWPTNQRPTTGIDKTDALDKHPEKKPLNSIFTITQNPLRSIQLTVHCATTPDEYDELFRKFEHQYKFRFSRKTKFSCCHSCWNFVLQWLVDNNRCCGCISV
ncbi:Eukaryotic translation initiation factor 3 subunit [Trichinella spiralis]|uniref:Eukaryotic translation initiation factor 3 subunit n=1 Tax=Trichinella spiralis TaxID=6334 RepID=A0ABR3KZT9_TRISP